MIQEKSQYFQTEGQLRKLVSLEDLEAVQTRSTGEQLLTQDRVYQEPNLFLDAFTLVQTFHLKKTLGKVSKSNIVLTPPCHL